MSFVKMTEKDYRVISDFIESIHKHLPQCKKQFPSCSFQCNCGLDKAILTIIKISKEMNKELANDG